MHDCKTLSYTALDAIVYKLADRIECGLELQLVLKYDKIWPIDEILQNPNPIKMKNCFGTVKRIKKSFMRKSNFENLIYTYFIYIGSI